MITELVMQATGVSGIYKMATGLAGLMAFISLAVFFVGWIRIGKESFRWIDYNMMGFGTLFLVTGVLSFLGGIKWFAVPAGYGFWAPPVGGMMVFFGLLRPCKLGIEWVESHG